MRCFEINIRELKEKQGKKLNNNMRCFEIREWINVDCQFGALNNNMRCFEILRTTSAASMH